MSLEPHTRGSPKLTKTEQAMLMNNVFKRKITQFTFIDNNFKRKLKNYEKNAHKMSVVYFKGGAVYFDLKSLAVKAFNLTIWISRRKKNRL